MGTFPFLMVQQPCVFEDSLCLLNERTLSHMCLCAGQSLTSVKTKAGEALRLHRTSVGEEALEEEEEQEGAERRREGGGENGDPDVSACEESSLRAAAPGRGVFSTLTHAVQNTV